MSTPERKSLKNLVKQNSEASNAGIRRVQLAFQNDLLSLKGSYNDW